MLRPVGVRSLSASCCTFVCAERQTHHASSSRGRHLRKTVSFCERSCVVRCSCIACVCETLFDLFLGAMRRLTIPLFVLDELGPFWTFHRLRKEEERCISLVCCGTRSPIHPAPLSPILSAGADTSTFVHLSVRLVLTASHVACPARSQMQSMPFWSIEEMHCTRSRVCLQEPDMCCHASRAWHESLF